MKRSLLYIAITVWAITSGYAQRIKAVSSSAQVRVESDMTKDEARDLARELAMIKAIEGEFGVYVDSETNITIGDGQVDFYILGNTRLKGEWIKTDQEKFREDIRKVKSDYGKEYETWITCELRGKIREITKAIPAFEAMPLVCPSLECVRYDFNKGDPFYMYFKTPEDGFLSVFMVEEDRALRLLPYQDMGSEYLNSAGVESDRDYILFSSDHVNGWNSAGFEVIDELYMDSEKDREFLKLVVVFSRSPITKPLLDPVSEVGEEYIIPQSVGRRDFEVWLQDNRIFDQDFFYKTIRLNIK